MKPINQQRGVPAGAAPGSAPVDGAAPGEPAPGTVGTARLASRLDESGGKRAAFGDHPARPAPLQARPPVHQADLPQAAYVVARVALVRPLTADAKSLLWTANETRKEVQALLAYGRGNIESGVRESGGDSKYRTVACRLVEGSSPTDAPSPGSGEPGSGPAAILEAWAEGPIVEPTDSRHGSGTRPTR